MARGKIMDDNQRLPKDVPDETKGQLIIIVTSLNSDSFISKIFPNSGLKMCSNDLPLTLSNCIFTANSSMKFI